MIYLVLGTVCLLFVLSCLGRANGFSWRKSFIEVLKVLTVFVVAIISIAFMVMGVDQLSQ